MRSLAEAKFAYSQLNTELKTYKAYLATSRDEQVNEKIKMEIEDRVKELNSVREDLYYFSLIHELSGYLDTKNESQKSLLRSIEEILVEHRDKVGLKYETVLD